MMAQQAAAQPVADQPGAAVRAAQAMAAGAAQGERGEAAPVEEQQSLLAGRERRPRAPPAGRAPASRRAAAGRAAGRPAPTAGIAAPPWRAGSSSARPAAAAPAADPSHPPGGLERRRRRDQDRRAALEARPRDRHLAAVIGDPVLLLEARVVLLVDHDQPERGKRQEQGRAGADHDPLAAFGDAPPGAPARGRAELGVPERRRPAEALGEALEQLRGERDLRQQDQRPAPGGEHRRHRLEIDRGLAGAGHAFEQRHAMAARDAGAERLRGLGLRRRERRRPAIGHRRRLGRLGQGRRRSAAPPAPSPGRRRRRPRPGGRSRPRCARGRPRAPPAPGAGRRSDPVGRRHPRRRSARAWAPAARARPAR